MATARPLAAGPPTCHPTSPNLNKDARIRRRPDKDEDRDRLKVGESADVSAAAARGNQSFSSAGPGQPPPRETSGGARGHSRGAPREPEHEAVRAAAPPDSPNTRPRAPQDFTEQSWPGPALPGGGPDERRAVARALGTGSRGPEGPGGPPRDRTRRPGAARGLGAMMVHCAGCERPILDRFLLNVLDRAWHIKCVQCCECKTNLSEKCFSREGKLYCKNDFFR